MDQEAMNQFCIFYLLCVSFFIICGLIYSHYAYDENGNRKYFKRKHKKSMLTKRLEENWYKCQQYIDKRNEIKNIENDLNNLFNKYGI